MIRAKTPVSPVDSSGHALRIVGGRPASRTTHLTRTIAALGAVVCAVSLIAFPGTAAVADPSTPAPSPSSSSAAPSPGQAPRTTFGVRPSGPQKPDGRATFTYGATPGAVVKDQVEISNPGDNPLTLRVYASDAFNTTEGGFDLLVGSKKPVDVGAWVAMDRGEVTVPAKSTIIVPFKLTIPANATPGDHVGGIVASLSTEKVDAKGDRVMVDQRVGSRIYVRIAGKLRPSLSVVGLTSTYHPTLNPFGTGRTTITYQVRNTGNIRLAGHQDTAVTLPWGERIEANKLPDVVELLPGNTMAVKTQVTGVFPALRLKTRVHVDPTPLPGDVDPVLTPVVRTRGFWAVSWTLLAVLVLAIGGVTWLVVRAIRRRRRDAAHYPDDSKTTNAKDAIEETG